MGTTERPQKESVFQKKHLIRLLLIGALIALAAAAFSYGVSRLLRAETGYRTVECTANAANCSSEFIFTYQLGVSGKSPTAELKAVTNLYNEQAVYYYRLFHPTEQFEDLTNVASLNAAPNTELTLPDALYAALQKAGADSGRNIYLAPFFAYYDTLFSSSYDEDAATWDPQRNALLRAEYDKTLVYAASGDHVRVELLGENKAMLYVSDAYLAYAKEAGITSFIDFYWMKNAFIADALAEDLINADLVHGVISSRDGFIRNTNPGDTEYAFDVFDERNGHLTAAGTLVYRGKAAICSLRPFALDDTEQLLLYTYADGERVTRYISMEDALPHGPAGAVTVYAKDHGCAELLLAALPCYLEDNAQAFSYPGAGMLWSDGKTVRVSALDGFTYTDNG